MFDFISTKLKKSLEKIKAKTSLKEEDIISIIQEIKIGLLEADVNFKVVKDFTKAVKEKAMATEISTKLNPEQHFIKIMKEELIKILGKRDFNLKLDHNPEKIMLVGLQGLGKTTTAAKLSLFIRKKLHAKKPLLIAADVYRPAAVKQLQTLGKQINVEVFAKENCTDPIKIVNDAQKHAFENKNDAIIVDTAGRLSIDEKLMKELEDLKKLLKPHHIVFVVDALVGQEIINVAKSFDEKLKLTGLIITKLDSDARGGSALSICSLLDIPILFIGTSEKLSGFEMFHPERMAKRILGMGDILTLIEKAESTIDEKRSKKLLNRLFSGQFDLRDLMDHLRQVKKMGKMSSIIKLIPGIGSKIDPSRFEGAEKKIKLFEILISSMTDEEKRNPKLLKETSRKKRIIDGSGRSNQDYNLLVNEFERISKQIKEMVKSVKDGTFNLKV